MQNSDQRMIDAQAKHISRMRTELEVMQKQLAAAQHELATIRDCGTFYRTMQQAILNDPMLQGEWIRFCSFLRLAAPDLETDFDSIKNTHFDFPFMY